MSQHKDPNALARLTPEQFRVTQRGWPSFTTPIGEANVVERSDSSHGMNRNEVRSSDADSHLGQVFDDGTPGAGGLRYCINSAAVRFVPLRDLKQKGYGDYLRLFGV